MTKEEILAHASRALPEFEASTSQFRIALSIPNSRANCSKPISTKELAETYAKRRDLIRTKGETILGLDSLVSLLKSSSALRWTVVGISGGAHWAALFVPDNGSPAACISKSEA